MFGPSTRLSLPTAGSPHIFRERHTHRHPKKGAGSPRNRRHTPKHVGFFPPFLCLLAGVGACIASFVPAFVCLLRRLALAGWTPAAPCWALASCASTRTSPEPASSIWAAGDGEQRSAYTVLPLFFVLVLSCVFLLFFFYKLVCCFCSFFICYFF